MRYVLVCMLLLGCSDYGLNLPMEVDPADPYDYSVDESVGDVGVGGDYDIPDAIREEDMGDPLGVENFGEECQGLITEVERVVDPEPHEQVILAVNEVNGTFLMEWHSDEGLLSGNVTYDLEDANFASPYLLESGFWAGDTDQYLIFYRALERGFDVMLPVDGYLFFNVETRTLIVQARLYTFIQRDLLNVDNCLDVEFVYTL